MEFLDHISPSMMHGIVVTVFLAVAYLLVSSRKLWALSVWIYIANLIALALYWGIDQMTGAGFNEAALYYLINAWSDVALLWNYPAFRVGLPALLVLVWAAWWIGRRSRPAGSVALSRLTQALIVLTTAGFSLYTTPLSADVMYTLEKTGVTHQDEIGLPRVLGDAAEASRQFAPAVKKNLIVVYAESMEQAFFDEALFPGLMPGLNQLMGSGVHVKNVQSAPMSNWTIAGMIASQCGVPLSSHRLRNEHNDFDKFSRNAKCLAQYLSGIGYHKAYMGGASGQFAGKADYYEAMAFEDIAGLEQLAGPNSPVSRWGIYDDELLAAAERKLIELRSKKPFALVMLTLDTHAPEGHATPACVQQKITYKDGSNAHLNNIRCSDVLLSAFLKKVIQDNIHDSTIIMLSDHVMMGSRANDELVRLGAQRLNHMVIWDKNLAPAVIVRPSNQFDLAPTMLHALSGQSIPIGFGVSLLSQDPTLTAQHGTPRFDSSVYAWRTSAWDQW